MQKLNRNLFMAAFIGGLFLGSHNSFTIWIHEQGHLQAFRMSGIQATQTDYNKVTAYAEAVTLDQLIAGAMSEAVFFFFAFWILFCFGNPNHTGIRGLWFPTGIPVGAILHIWIRAYQYTDFHREFSSEIAPLWTIFCVLVLSIMIGAITIWRWRIK